MLRKRKIKQLAHCPAGRDFRVWALKETSTRLVFRDRSILRIYPKEANSLIGESDLRPKQKSNNNNQSPKHLSSGEENGQKKIRILTIQGGTD